MGKNVTFEFMSWERSIVTNGFIFAGIWWIHRVYFTSIIWTTNATMTNWIKLPANSLETCFHIQSNLFLIFVADRLLLSSLPRFAENLFWNNKYWNSNLSNFIIITFKVSTHYSIAFSFSEINNFQTFRLLSCIHSEEESWNQFLFFFFSQDTFKGKGSRKEYLKEATLNELTLFPF